MSNIDLSIFLKFCPASVSIEEISLIAAGVVPTSKENIEDYPRAEMVANILKREPIGSDKPKITSVTIINNEQGDVVITDQDEILSYIERHGTCNVMLNFDARSAWRWLVSIGCMSSSCLADAIWPDELQRYDAQLRYAMSLDHANKNIKILESVIGEDQAKLLIEKQNKIDELEREISSVRWLASHTYEPKTLENNSESETSEYSHTQTEKVTKKQAKFIVALLKSCGIEESVLKGSITVLRQKLARLPYPPEVPDDKSLIKWLREGGVNR
ncbi:hypothetical protein [Aeromonas veronii]|uniref:hypothetical protein n=1 Tax=Aeromonas veronii TaxID=654 RepID=UPI001302E7B4|nr:hypothetical protein [Aeromonas veronii]KAE9627734.1 hypothetical protein GO977_21930 [Aeromonas veronii]